MWTSRVSSRFSPLRRLSGGCRMITMITPASSLPDTNLNVHSPLPLLSRRFMGADKRVFSKVTDSRAVEYYLEDVDGEEDPLGDVRNFLYPEEEEDDDRLVDVSHAESVDAVFEALGHDSKQWTHKHTTQAVSTLFHLQKRCGLPESKERDCTTVRDFTDIMNKSDNLDRLLSRLGEHYREVDLRKLAYCFMCLRRLSASSESPTCTKVLRDIQILLSKSFDSMDLTTLTYFAVGLRDRNMLDSKVRSTSLTWGLALAPAMPAIEKFVDAAETAEDLRQLAICINAASRIASVSIMDKFASKVSERIAAGVFDAASAGKDNNSFDLLAVSSLCKILSLTLTKKDWHDTQNDFTTNILLALKGRVRLMTPLQVLITSKVLGLKMSEPVSVFYEINDRVKELFENNIDQTQPKVSKGDLLRALIQGGMNILDKKQLTAAAKDMLKQDSWSWDFNNVFDIVRKTRICDEELRDLLFTRALELKEDVDCILSLNDEDAAAEMEWDCSGQHNTRLAIRYLTSNEHAMSSKNFEQEMISRFQPTLLDCPFVRKFSIAFSFVLAYSQDSFSKEVMEKYHSMVANMDALALYTVMRGAHIRRGQYHNEVDDDTQKMLDEITLAAAKRTKTLFSQKDDNFSNRLLLLRALMALDYTVDEAELTELIESEFFRVLKSDRNPSTIRELSFMIKRRFTHINIMPEMLDSFIKYIVSNRVHAHSRSCFGVLELIFLVCHDPEKSLGGEGRTFFTVCNSCLLRDFDNIVGQSIIRACITLAKYKMLSRELAEAVFSEKFMSKLDAEMANFDIVYSRKLREWFMELNRTVTLIYPEYEIPWFHDSYCKNEHRAFRTKNKSYSKMREEVYDRLSAAVGGYRFVQEDVASPYYNRIDFEVVVDKHGRPVPAVEAAASDRFSVINRSGVKNSRNLLSAEGRQWRHLAILVCPESVTVGEDKRTPGRFDLHVEQLELQGYEVIVIKPNDWNSMNMSNVMEKENFLKKRIRAAS